MPRGEKDIYLRPGEAVRVIAGTRLAGKPLISEEERQAQLARNRVLGHARDAARQLALPVQFRQSGRAEEMEDFDMEEGGRLGKLAKELHQVGITREQLVTEISRTYQRSQHHPPAEEALDLARSFVDSLPGFAEAPEESQDATG